MKVVVIGANGQLGSDFCDQLTAVDLVPLTHADIEISDFDSAKQVLLKHRPDVVINTAAYLKADDCEVNPDTAFRVNALGAQNVAIVCDNIGAKIVYISSDYVFGGKKERRTRPYSEFDTTVPANIYGHSKLAGELAVMHFCHRHYIIRASGFFGVAGSRGKGGNFVDTMMAMARRQDDLRVVHDQVFSPTYTKDLARKIIELIGTEYYGIYHVTNRGSCSWYEFTREIIRLSGLNVRVTSITSDQYPQKAKRPAYSVLDNCHLRLLGLDGMRPWQDPLADYMQAKGYSPGT